MTNPPPPPGSYPPPPPGGNYPPPPQSGGYQPPPPPPGGGYQPPPPPQAGGYQPPPPPAGGAYPPPPQQQGGYAPPPPASFGAPSPDTYVSWGTRAKAGLVDWLPVLILWSLGPASLFIFQKVETVCITDDSEYQLGDFCATGNNGPSGLGWALFVLLPLIGLAFLLWNTGFKQGTTGSSIGKRMQGFKIVDEATGQPAGVGKSIGRALIYTVAYAVCGGILWLVAILFPLFDAKRQTLVDKLIKTVALPL